MALDYIRKQITLPPPKYYFEGVLKDMQQYDSQLRYRGEFGRDGWRNNTPAYLAR
jgi:hypothetical protein